MRTVDFQTLSESGLLENVERIAISLHALIHRDLRAERWSPAIAYRWFRYESTDPALRLLEGVRRLRAEYEELPSHDLLRTHQATIATIDSDFQSALELARVLGYRSAPAAR